MTILITGGSGFIGKYLIKDLLNHNYKIRILSRQNRLNIKNVEVIKGDITNYNDCLTSLNGVNAVFHNAAYATDYGKKKKIYNINVNGTKNILRASLEKNVNRIIYTSTAGVYGFPNIQKKLDENSNIKPFNLYHKSKYEGEVILKSSNKIKLSIIRPPLVLGYGGKGPELLIDRIKNGKMIYIGDGTQYISIVHPSDVAQCLRLAYENDKKGDVFNVVSFYCKIKDLFNEFSKELHVKPPRKNVSYIIAYLAAFANEKINFNEPNLTRFRVKSLGTTRFIDFEKAKKILDYKPKYDLEMTVKDMVKNIK